MILAMIISNSMTSCSCPTMLVPGYWGSWGVALTGHQPMLPMLSLSPPSLYVLLMVSEIPKMWIRLKIPSTAMTL